MTLCAILSGFAETSTYLDQQAWNAALSQSPTGEIKIQPFNGFEVGDTDIPVATDTSEIFGNFSVYYETIGGGNDTGFDYSFDSDSSTPLDLGIDVLGTDQTTRLEFQFEFPQIAFAARFDSVDVGEGLTLTLLFNDAETGEVVNLDALLAPTGGDGFVGFIADRPFTAFAFGPLLSDNSMVFSLDDVSTVEVGVPGPSLELTSLTQDGLGFRLPSTVPGHLYQLQSNLGLQAEGWQDLGGQVIGSGSMMMIEAEVLPNDPVRFFRVAASAP